MVFWRHLLDKQDWNNLFFLKMPSTIVKVILEDTRGHRTGYHCCKMGVF